MFSKVYDQSNFWGRKNFVEILQGHSLDKIINFHLRKLLINTIYKIGIGLIIFLKCFNEKEFFYLEQTK